MTPEGILIGSRALSFHTGKDYGGDTDIIPCPEHAGKYNIERVEIHDNGFLNNADVFDYACDTTVVDGHKLFVCSLRGLALIKRSHMHRLWKWDRNLFMFKQLGWPSHRDSLTDDDRAFLKTRKKLTKQELKSPSLMKSNEEFFDDNVKKHFVHDDIHAFVAYGDRPMYERMKNDFDLARCEKDMWNEFSFEDKCRCVLEECYVIGLERWIVPAAVEGKPVMPSKFAVHKALKKVCTTLCSGWFRDFAIDYYDDIVSRIDVSKMEAFKKEKLDGRVLEVA